jgi:hypothetical protein
LLAAGLWLLASDTLSKFREEANKIIMIFFGLMFPINQPLTTLTKLKHDFKLDLPLHFLPRLYMFAVLTSIQQPVANRQKNEIKKKFSQSISASRSQYNSEWVRISSRSNNIYG